MTTPLLTDFMQTQADLKAPSVRIQLVQYRLPPRCEALLVSEGTFRLEVAVSPRSPSARGCYPASWAAERFEPIGEMFLTPPSQNLLLRYDEASPMDAVVCHLDRDLFVDLYVEHLSLDASYPHREGEGGGYLPATLDLRNSRIRTLLLRMADEAREPGIASETLVSTLAMQLAIELLRVGATLGAARRQGGLASWQLRRIDERLNQIDVAPSLSELASLCHISVRHLTRAFKESRGYTIGSFVHQQHMGHAKRLLAEGCSVTLIASRLGFAASSGLCAAFRRETGLTPGEFREKFLQAAEPRNAA